MGKGFQFVFRDQGIKLKKQTICLEALEVGEKFLGPGYKEIGKSGSGVFRNGQRQFRIDANSLLGKHKPWESHIHLETFKLGDKHPSIINHILIYE